jgi:hypothetical protein
MVYDEPCHEGKRYVRRRPRTSPSKYVNVTAYKTTTRTTISILVLVYLSSTTAFVSWRGSRDHVHYYAEAFGNLVNLSKSKHNQTNGIFQTLENRGRVSLSSRSHLTCVLNEKRPDKTRDHYNDALLNRIITGRMSTSPRWRKRTRRAVAALGIQRQHKNHQDYLEDQELINQERFTQRPIVPPPTSTIFRGVGLEEKSKWPSLHKSPGPRLKIKKFHKRRRKLTQEQHARAKLEWAAKYTSIHTLRQSFGRNRNKIWGDFDPQTTRKLYHTLLPRALLGLYEVGLWSPTDLAPLAFEARIAAKKYARERCILPGRLASMAYDGFRTWRRWGKWSPEGMSWEQIWNKYETQILEEYMEDNSNVDLDELQEEITAQICLKILERSCITNEAIDKMFLDDETNESREMKRRRRRNAERDLAKIKIKLERDMKELLQDHDQLRVSNRKKSPFYLDVLGAATFGSQDCLQLEKDGNGVPSYESELKVYETIDRDKLDSRDIFVLRLLAKGKRKLNKVSQLFPAFALQ